MNQSPIKPEHQIKTSALKPILWGLLTLFSGIIIGVGLTLIITDQSEMPKSLPPGPEYISKRMVNRIARELKLSPVQHEQLGPIVQKHMNAVDEIRKQARPQISDELDEMNEEILSILNEQQKVIWKDHVQRMQDHFMRMRRHRGPDHNPRKERKPRLESQRPQQPLGDRMPVQETPSVEDIAPSPSDEHEW
jgi:hypothetical protein